MPTTQQRLDNYYAAETKILKAQEVRGGDVNYRRAELAEIRAGITQLERQLAREKSGQKFRHSLANLNRS